MIDRGCYKAEHMTVPAFCIKLLPLVVVWLQAWLPFVGSRLAFDFSHQEFIESQFF